MNDIKDLDNPSFVMLPFPSDRTSWRAFGLPMILVVPHVRDADGNLLPNADIVYDDKPGARIYIAGVDSIAPVAGYDHRGIYNPDINIYSYAVLPADFISRKITNMTPVGGRFTFTSRIGITSSLTHLPHADYFDLSDIKLEVEQLPPNKYILVYEARFFTRRVSDTARLVCVDSNSINAVRYQFTFNHPGDIILQMVQSTPALYMTNVLRSEDTTISFYRPFAEIMQDLHDEQAYLEKLNWVYEVHPEHIPYLGFLLGWDLPYFPESVDNLRRAVLRNMVRLQRLKGTKRAVRELFDLFGFTVNIGNVWWTPDGKKYVGPGEDPAYPVTLTPTAVYEPLLLDYSIDGYAAVTIPLINRPSVKTAVIESFLVERGSEAENNLKDTKAIVEGDIDAISDQDILQIINRAWIDIYSATPGVIGYSRINIDETGTGTLADQAGWPVHGPNTVRIDYRSNVLTISCSRHVAYGDNLTLYTFISYQYDKLSIPASMQQLQSNRFDIEILNKSGETVRADVIDFLVDFIFQVKAFHSLLRKVLYTVEVTDVYQVTDWCVGGLITQDPNKDAGKQQVPPETIIPHVGTDICSQLDPALLGYRPQDLKYRNTVLALLNLEFEAWKAIGANCDHNYRGQDRITAAPTQETGGAKGAMVYSQPVRASLCILDGNDYCYKGRVSDTMTVQEVITASDTWQFRMCGPHLGTGIYFTFPTTHVSTESDRINGGLYGRYISEYKDGVNALHYTNANFLDTPNFNPNRFEALRRPPLLIEKDNLCFPGHRLPTLNKLYNDYVSSTYDHRPWDFEPFCGCPPYGPNPLNARIVVNTSGQEHLVYDNKPYSVKGNGLVPDISSLGSHSSGSTGAEDVTHKIFIAHPTGHPAVTLDGVVEEVGIIDIAEPIFKSAVLCGTNYKDYSQGYPASIGFLDLSGFANCADPVGATFRPVCYFPGIINRTDAEAIRQGLGLPPSQATPPLLFTVSSQIRVELESLDAIYYSGYRLDCGCHKLVCSGSAIEGSILSCTVSEFLTQFGDLHPDQLQIISVPTAEAKIGAQTFQLNDLTSSLFDLKQTLGDDPQVTERGYPNANPFPSSGSFSYQDAYDIIYDIMWSTIPDPHRPVVYLDFVTVKKEPRRAGISERAGRIVNREIFIDGTITTTRQLFTKAVTGSQLIAEGEEQVFGTYQGSFLCSNKFIDPFVLHLDNSITDDVEGSVTGGPHWGDPALAGDSAEDTVWGDPSASHPEAMVWINVFGA